MFLLILTDILGVLVRELPQNDCSEYERQSLGFRIQTKMNRTLYFVWKFLLKRFKAGNIHWIFSKELRILPACEHCDKKFEIVLIALQKLSSQIYSKQASFAGIFKKEAKSLLLSVIVTLY